ncbi:unnamed protein product, partial [Mesorhabditis spiculigera]
MDEDLEGVLIVLGILGIGIIGAIVLLILYAEPVRRLLRLHRDKEDEEDIETGGTPKNSKKKSMKRTHIVVAQGKNVFEIDEEAKSIRKVSKPSRQLTVAVHPAPSTPRSLPSTPLGNQAPVSFDDVPRGKIAKTNSAPFDHLEAASSVSGSGPEGIRSILRRPLVPSSLNGTTSTSSEKKNTVLIIHEGNRFRKIVPSEVSSLPTSPEQETNYLPGYRALSDRRSSCS